MVPTTGTPLRAHRLRPVNVPRRVEVDVDSRGLPVSVRSGWGRSDAQVEAGSNGNETRPSAARSPHPERAQVEAVGEEWRVYDEWWRRPIMRRYMDVVLEGGKHTVLYQDEISGEWFEQTP